MSCLITHWRQYLPFLFKPYGKVKIFFSRNCVNEILCFEPSSSPHPLSCPLHRQKVKLSNYLTSLTPNSCLFWLIGGREGVEENSPQWSLASFFFNVLLRGTLYIFCETRRITINPWKIAVENGDDADVVEVEDNDWNGTDMLLQVFVTIESTVDYAQSSFMILKILDVDYGMTLFRVC